MPYYYIEHMYPEQDPNIDLNFDNDILYKSLLRDNINASSMKYKNTSDVNPSKKHNSLRQTNDNDNNKSNTTLYIFYIVVIIMLVLFWYMYRRTGKGKGKEKENDSYIIDNRADYIKLNMLSPDIGMGARYETNM